MWLNFVAVSLGPTLAVVVTWLLSRRQVGKVAETINGQHEVLKSDLDAANAKINSLHEARLTDARSNGMA